MPDHENVYFLDTWAWLALLNKSDGHHVAVLELMTKLVGSTTRLWSCWPVIAETIGNIANKARQGHVQPITAHRAARRFHDDFTKSDFLQWVIAPTEEDFQAALSLRVERKQSTLSLVDALIVRLCERYGIRHVVSGDKELASVASGIVLVDSVERLPPLPHGPAAF